jgi:hypothetical protein
MNSQRSFSRSGRPCARHRRPIQPSGCASRYCRSMISSAVFPGSKGFSCGSGPVRNRDRGPWRSFQVQSGVALWQRDDMDQWPPFRGGGVGRAADPGRARAARVEMASRRRVQGRRRLAPQRCRTAAPGGVGPRARRAARLAYRGAGAAEDLLPRPAFDDPAQIHHAHPVAQVAHHRQVMRDEQKRQPSRSRRSRSRFMICACTETSTADTGSSATMKRGSIASARAMPIRCRCPPEMPSGAVGGIGGQTDKAQQFRDPAPDLALGPQAVDAQHLGQRLAHRHPGVERGKRVLKDHLHIPPRGAAAPGRPGAQVGPVEGDPPRGRLDQPQQAAAQRRLARPGFAHKAQDLAPGDVEGHVIDRDQRRPCPSGQPSQQPAVPG